MGTIRRTERMWKTTKMRFNNTRVTGCDVTVNVMVVNVGVASCKQ